MKAKSINKKFIIITVAILAVISLLGISTLFNKVGVNTIASNGNLPISEIMGSYTIDFNNINELVGDADYVFVGTVISEDSTVYKHPVMIETEDNKEYELTSPYTNYTINVMKNIKGELITDTEIPIQKAGGLAKDGSQYVIYEEDELPVTGGIYVFYAYAQPDGSLLVSGPKSNKKINVKPETFNSSDSANNIENISEVQKVIEALDDQIKTDRQRFVSNYDEG